MCIYYAKEAETFKKSANYKYFNKLQDRVIEATGISKGFGLYSVLYSCLTGVIVISYACVAFGSTVIVPASACDLGTTTAQQGAMVAVPIVGNVLGAMVWGYLADARGRRTTLLMSLALAATVNAVASLSVHWAMLLALQFFATMLSSAQHPVSMTLLSESVPAAWRNVVVLLVTSVFLLAQGIMSVLGMPILPLTFSHYIPALGIYWTSWRLLLLVYSLPSCVSIVWLFFMKESPKFVMAKGDADGALEILKTIHRVNKGKSKVFEVAVLAPERGDAAAPAQRSSLVPLFKAPLLKNTIIMSSLFLLFPMASGFSVWLPTLANQFMQILQTGEGSDLTLCRIISAYINAPDDSEVEACAINVTALLIVLGVGGLSSLINALLSVVVQYGGRRNTAMGCTAVFGLCGILVNLVPSAVGSAVLFVGYLQSVLVIGLYTAISMALFPTHLRAKAMALVMTGGRALSFGTIQLVNYLIVNNCELGFYLFASLYSVSAVILAFLPDDRLAPTPQPPPDARKEEEDAKL